MLSPEVSKAVQQVFLAIDAIQFQRSFVHVCDLHHRSKLSYKFRMAGKIFPQIGHTVCLQSESICFLNERKILLPDGNGRTVEKLTITVLAFDQCQF